MARFVVLAIVAVLAAACGSGPASTPVANSSSSPSSTATPSPLTWGPTVLVSGKETCTVVTGDLTTDPDGTGHYRNGVSNCREEANDPRVSGTETGDWNADTWGKLGDGALVQWGTLRLENSGGVWVGHLTGVYSSKTGDLITVWFQGSEGYAGLSYYQRITGFGPWQFTGLIYPGSPPTQ